MSFRFGRKLIIVLILLFVFCLPLVAAKAATDPTLMVDGVTLTQTDGTRFIIKGVNLEYYRDSGCKFITDNTIAQKSQIIAKMKSLGINAVRLNYKASWLSQSATYVNNYLDIMQALSQNGIYSMPSDHSFTGKALSGYATTSFPIFKSLVEGARSRGIEKYLIMNPYNEPYGGDSTGGWANWITANKATLDYLRKDLSFKGVVVLDTKDWAGNFDKTSLQNVLAYDTTLMNGRANLVFANHWYPNHDYTSRVKPTLDASNQLPMLIGELGRINPGTTGVVDSYPKNVFNNIVALGIPNGHNGVYPWIWSWCDENNMTASDEDLVTLSSYGQAIVNDYFAKTTGVWGDLNEDGKVDGVDFVKFVKAYGTNTTQAYKVGDLNGNGMINTDDLTILINIFKKKIL